MTVSGKIVKFYEIKRSLTDLHLVGDSLQSNLFDKNCVEFRVSLQIFEVRLEREVVADANLVELALKLLARTRTLDPSGRCRIRGIVVDRAEIGKIRNQNQILVVTATVPLSTFGINENNLT